MHACGMTDSIPNFIKLNTFWQKRNLLSTNEKEVKALSRLEPERQVFCKVNNPEYIISWNCTAH